MNAPVNDKIAAACGHCGARYRIQPGQVGRQVRCAQCQAVFVRAPLAASGGPRPGPAPAPPHPAAPGPGVPGGAGGQTPPHQQWIANAMMEVVCPHCQSAIPLSRSFLGSYLGCPRCREKFIISADGTAQLPEPPFHRRLLEDKRFLRVALGGAAILVLLAACGLFLSSRRDGRLVRAMAEVYPAPNYVITPIKPSKDDRTAHKTADGSRECSPAYVQVAHKPTGMEFNRVLCEFDGRWQPTFRQRIADQVAAEYIERQEGSSIGGFDPGALPWTVYNQNASHMGGIYKNAEVPEEQKLAGEFGPALRAMTRTGDEPEAGAAPEAVVRDYDEDGDDDYDLADFDYAAEVAAYEDKFYLAHAVMYPDQAGKLFQAGKISQMP